MSDKPFTLPIMARVALAKVADPRVRALVDALEAYSVTLQECDWHAQHLEYLVEGRYDPGVVEATTSRLAVLEDEARRGFEALQRAGAAFDAPSSSAAQGDLQAFAAKACLYARGVEDTSQAALNAALSRIYEATRHEAALMGRLPPPPPSDRKGP